MKYSHTWFAAAAATVVASSAAEAQTVYNGSPLTDVSGVACRPMRSSQEGNLVAREISHGLAVLSNFPATGMMTFECPMNRRNTSVYGVNASSRDRVRVTTLRARIYDGSSQQVAWCNGYVSTASGSQYWSSSRYACGSFNGCTSLPANSYVGERELVWSNPFGTSDITNVGAVNVATECTISRNSNIYSLRAVYSAN